MKNETTKITSKRLKEVLDEFDMKPQELADKTGINKSSISQYVNGSHAPSNITAGKMAEVFKVNPVWLMGFDVEKRKEYSEESANSDYDLSKKMSQLSSRDKEIVLNMIDFMISTYER